MEKLPFDIHFCIYNFLEFEKKYEMRFILEVYNQLFINDINKQNISIELIKDHYGDTIIKKYIYNEDYFYKNLYIDKITLDKINNFKTLKEQNNFIEKILINKIKTTNEVFMIKICNKTPDYILSISGKPNKYREYDNYEYEQVDLVSYINSDCDY